MRVHTTLLASLCYAMPFSARALKKNNIFFDVDIVVKTNRNALNRALNSFIIKFPYNARSDWLKQRALSENRARVDDGKLASSNFCFGILTNLTQIKHALWLRQIAVETSYLSAVNIAAGRPLL